LKLLGGGVLLGFVPLICFSDVCAEEYPVLHPFATGGIG